MQEIKDLLDFSLSVHLLTDAVVPFRCLVYFVCEL